MGVGNLICMPLALAVGRRAIYLASLILALVGGLLAAYSKDYNWHLGARFILGLAAGNSEALVPMMIQVSRVGRILCSLPC
jgi:predicted MFS family arabinose efflux permease